MNLPRSDRPTKITPRAQRRLIQEVTKEPRTTSKELQDSLPSVKVSVHDSTMRQRLGKNGIHGRVPRRKPLLTKKNTMARLTFAKQHLDDPQDFWDNILWTDETKVELFGQQWFSPFLPNLFLIVESWTLTLTEAVRPAAL